MWSGIWSVATTMIGLWTWIWPTRHCWLGQEVPCWFWCRKNSTSFVWSVNNRLVANDVKMYGPVLEEKWSFEMLRLTFSSKVDWDSYIFSMAKTACKTYEVSSSWCCSGGPSCYLKLLNKLQKPICRNVGPLLAAFLEHLGHRQNVDCMINCTIFLSPFLDFTRMSMSIVVFLTQLDPGILCL